MMAQIIAPSSRCSTNDLERRAAIFNALGNRVALINRELRFLLEKVMERPLPASRRHDDAELLAWPAHNG